jgi:hypothetical protein
MSPFCFFVQRTHTALNSSRRHRYWSVLCFHVGGYLIWWIGVAYNHFFSRIYHSPFLSLYNSLRRVLMTHFWTFRHYFVFFTVHGILIVKIGVLGFDSRRGMGIFLFTTASRTALEPTQPPIQWVPGAVSLRVKRPGREAKHSPPSSVEVKEWVELYLHSPNTPSWHGA